MKTALMVSAMCLSMTVAHAQDCKNGQCRYYPGKMVVQATTATAQGVASIMAREGHMRHMGGNPYPYEGVGMGSTPNQALNNCCYAGQRPVADEGVAQSPNGKWFACRRYR
jgi:hypothetical protein